MGIEGKMDGAAEVELGRTLSEITGTSFHSKTAEAVGTPAEGAIKKTGRSGSWRTFRWILSSRTRSSRGPCRKNSRKPVRRWKRPRLLFS